MNIRFRLALALFGFFFFCITARLFYWQFVRAEELVELGEAQYGSNIKVQPVRGEIQTSDGYSIAANKITYRIFANPKEVKESEKERTSQILAKLLDMDTASISALLAMDRFWVSLKTGVEEPDKQLVENQNIPGVGFEEQTVRYYPEASTAAKLLGFVGKDEDGNNKGYFGLEGYYDRQLRGKAGYAVQIHDAYGHPILAKTNPNTSSQDGRTVTLNVDRAIQFLTERELKNGIEKYGAASGMAALIDPLTGGVLAMAAFPTFDPQNYRDYSDALYKNPFITDTYEPGSTFKPLVMAQALDKDLVKPDTPCDICAGPVSIGGYDIRTWNNEYQPGLTMTEVIQHSDNTGMVFVSKKLGLNGMVKLLDTYGIGELTGIDLQGEQTPFTRPRDSWYPIDVATASFGQGIVVTPIELLTAFTAVANGGKRMEPHVVKEIKTADGKTITIKPKVLNKTFSEKTAKVVTEMMVNAVDNGEAKWAKPKGYRIAGKTGTAQIPIAGHYDANKTIASFVGFAPADDPKFVMLVVVDRPTTSIYGAETAAPIFFNIAKSILMYYNIPPTEAE